MNTTLIIMAAGIGSRFGEGIKQLAQMGPNIVLHFCANGLLLSYL
jgi:2-C-methyl-D-erythritol 4-phosphate cytidylyltransferase